MRRAFLLAAGTGLAAIVGLTAYLAKTPADPPKSADPPPIHAAAAVPSETSVQLPIGQVVLFSSGVGYFQREGAGRGQRARGPGLPHAGHQRPAQEHGPARPRRRPRRRRQLRQQRPRREDAADRFAIEPDGQPDLRPDPQPGPRREGRGRPAAGQRRPARHDDRRHRRRRAEAGDRRQGRRRTSSSSTCGAPRACGRVKLSEVQRVRFLNPVMDNEVKKALETLALSHDTQKKAVSLSFVGEGQAQRAGRLRRSRTRSGRRAIAWCWARRRKTSRSCKAGRWWRTPPTRTGRTCAWRWSAAGRSRFQMDLYTPLYVPRPTVEPELFASLRPATYNDALNRPLSEAAADEPAQARRTAASLWAVG